MRNDPRRKLLSEALERVSEPLERAGFARFGDTFNRATEPGLTQVVNLQLNKYVTEFEFAVNIGIYLDKVAEALDWPRALAPPVKESTCQMRTRLSEIMPSAKSQAWSKLSGESAAEVSGGLQEYGLPLFERFRSMKGIVKEWKLKDTDYWPSWVSPLVIAVLLSETGSREEALQILRKQEAETHGAPGAKQVEKSIRKLGFTASAA
jgi:hypothetical protein